MMADRRAHSRPPIRRTAPTCPEASHTRCSRHRRVALDVIGHMATGRVRQPLPARDVPRPATIFDDAGFRANGPLSVGSTGPPATEPRVNAFRRRHRPDGVPVGCRRFTARKVGNRPSNGVVLVRTCDGGNDAHARGSTQASRWAAPQGQQPSPHSLPGVPNAAQAWRARPHWRPWCLAV